MIRKRGLTADPANQNGISRDENQIRNNRTPDKVFYYHLNVIPTACIRYGQLMAYSGNQNDISHNENQRSNARSINKGLSPRSEMIAPAAYIRIIRIIGTHYLFGKPVYNSAG